MVIIGFPGLSFGPIAASTGSWLDISLLGLGIKVPPVDLTLLPQITVWNAFTLFDTDWIIAPIAAAVSGVAKAVWDLFEGTLNSWAEAFYKKHCTYDEYVRERDARNKASEKT